MLDMWDELDEYTFYKVSFWKPAAKAAAAGRKVFIQGIRTGIKAKTPAQKALALRLKGQGKKMLGRSARGYSEGADSEGVARKRKSKIILGSKGYESLRNYKKETVMKPRRTAARRERRANRMGSDSEGARFKSAASRLIEGS